MFLQIMNALDLFTKSYSALHNYPGVPYWVLTPFRKIVRNAANKILPAYLAKPKQHKQVSQKDLIVSFTSFPARINDVWQVVESLKNQRVLPEKIILWLSKEQFPTRESIPVSLWVREDNLFEIRMVDGDIRSHKKFYYVMHEFPDKAFVTCDDDIYYHPDMLKALIRTSEKFPGCVIANTSRHIEHDENGEPTSYRVWKSGQKLYRSDNLIQIGVGGVLYPPHTLHRLTLCRDVFMNVTPMADDIWLNCMARLNNTPVVQSGFAYLPLSIASNSPSLSSVNNGQNRNDVQIAQLRAYLKSEQLPDVYSADYSVEASGGG